MRAPKPQRMFALLFLLALVPSLAHAASQNGGINVSLNRTRPQRGETVEVTVQAPPADAISSQPIHVLLLQPTIGTTELVLRKVSGRNAYRAEIPLGPQAPEGIYVVHVWRGQISLSLPIWMKDNRSRIWRTI